MSLWRSIAERIAFLVARRTNELLQQSVNEALLRHGIDIEALARLHTLYRPRLPWTKFAMRPGNIECILNEISLHQRRTIIEFGSGISTLYIAAAAPHATVLSVDESEEWQDVIRAEARRAGLDISRIEFLAAPVAPGREGTPPWYDVESILRAAGPRRFDLAIVDGPKSNAEPRRGAAAQFLVRLLAPDFAILVDDAAREHDLRMVRDWAEQHRWLLSFDRTRRLAMLRPQNTAVRFDISP